MRRHQQPARRQAIDSLTSATSLSLFATIAPVDYPDYVRRAARAVAGDRHSLGVILGLATSDITGIEAMAASTEGWSGAELAALTREAGISAIRRGVGQEAEPESVSISSWDLGSARQRMEGKRADLDARPYREDR